MNRISKIIGIMIVILFFSLYFSKYSMDYNQNKKILTEEAIQEYEKDLKEGIEINPEKYQEPEKDYNNRVSKVGLNTSKLIEKGFQKGLKLLMKSLKYLEESN
jgi:hypothetical protein